MRFGILFVYSWVLFSVPSLAELRNDNLYADIHTFHILSSTFRPNATMQLIFLMVLGPRQMAIM